MSEYNYFDRDLSWLTFNYRVLEEAAREETPLLEKIRFLSIYSSNLDEFYRVRIPALMALEKINQKRNQPTGLLSQVNKLVDEQQQLFGSILARQIVPSLEEKKIDLCYNGPIPGEVKAD